MSRNLEREGSPPQPYTELRECVVQLRAGLASQMRRADREDREDDAQLLEDARYFMGVLMDRVPYVSP